MNAPTFKQRKILAATRIAAGLVTALYLGYVLVANWLAGAPLTGKLMMVALVAVAGLAYAAWGLRALATVAREEGAARPAND